MDRLINSNDEWAVTPAQSFSSEVDSEIRRLEREGMRAAINESQERSDKRLRDLRGNLILAWRALTEDEESSISEALSVIAADVHNRSTSQESLLLSDELFTLSEAAGRSNL